MVNKKTEREEWGSVGGGGEDPALVFVAVGGADHYLYGHFRLDGRHDDWRGSLRSGTVDGAVAGLRHGDRGRPLRFEEPHEQVAVTDFGLYVVNGHVAGTLSLINWDGDGYWMSIFLLLFDVSSAPQLNADTRRQAMDVIIRCFIRG